MPSEQATLIDLGKPTHIRWMVRRDMPEVMAIEQSSFEYAWTEDDFMRFLRNRNSIGMLAEETRKQDPETGRAVWGAVAGFFLYELFEDRLHIHNFAVHPDWRRHGVGTKMVARLLSKLSSHRRTHITLEVRESNLAAQLFFRSCWFRAVRVLRRFYEDSGESAFHFVYDLEAP